MTATTHTLTGAVIGALVPIPFIAIPLAFLAHFALDAMPHFDTNEGHTNKSFLYYLAIDSAFALSLLISLAVLQPDNWVLLAACGIACASPDLMWFMPWINEMRGKANKAMGPIRSFHAKIQWAANKKGAIFEIPWFVVMVVLFVNLTTS